MKLVEMKCKNCGAILKVDDEAKEAKCVYCNATFKIVDESAVQAGYDFEKGRIKAQQEIKEEAERKVQEEKERIEQIRAQNIAMERERLKAAEEEKRKKTRLIWWILCWIFLTPVALSIWVWHREWDKKIRIAVIITIWLIVLIFYSSDIGKIFGN